MRKSICILSLLWITLCPFTAQAGTEISGGGGVGLVAEFSRTARMAFERLKQRGALIVAGQSIDVDAMEKKLKAAKIEVTDKKLVLDGKVKDAINFPALEKIVFNATAWKNLKKQNKIQLVLHEMLGLTFKTFKDDDYSFSTTLLSLVKESTVEDVAMAMAMANFVRADKVKLIPARTTKEHYASNEDDPSMTGRVFTFYVQTFENSSPEAVRIFKVWEDETGGVVNAKLIGGEGPIGP